MGRRTFSLLSPLAVAVLTACGEEGQGRDLTTSPEFAPGGRPVANTCDFNGLNSIITSYFPGNRGSSVLSLKQSMATAGEDTPEARALGFAIMDSIGYLSREVAVDTSLGARLTVGLIQCMFELPDPEAFPNFPDAPVYDFGLALHSTTGGAYYTRGPGAGSDSVVLATDYSDPDTTDNLSGVAPPPGFTEWSDILGQRVLIYGFRTSTTPLIYEWATIPANATFSPSAVVAICDGDVGSTAMVHETNVGILAFAGGDYICSQSRTMAMHERGWGLRALARSIVRVVSPTPLQAAAFLKSGSGGTATTFKSKFSKKLISGLSLEFAANEPPSNVAVDPATFPVAVKVSAQEGTTSLAVLGVCVYLTGTNNNGQPTMLLGTQHQTCDDERPEGIPVDAPSALTQPFTTAQSKADFGNTVHVTKTGGLLLTATAKVVDRSGTGFVTKKINVKPR